MYVIGRHPGFENESACLIALERTRSASVDEDRSTALSSIAIVQSINSLDDSICWLTPLLFEKE
jgi:hypothetical protein